MAPIRGVWVVHIFFLLCSNSAIPSYVQPVSQTLTLLGVGTVLKGNLTAPGTPNLKDDQEFSHFQEVLKKNMKDDPRYQEYIEAAKGRGGTYSALEKVIYGGKVGIELDHAPPVLVVTDCLPTVQGLSGQLKEWVEEKIRLDRKLQELEKLKENVGELDKKLTTLTVEKLEKMVAHSDYLLPPEHPKNAKVNDKLERRPNYDEYAALKQDIKEMAKDSETIDKNLIQQKLKDLVTIRKHLAEQYFSGQVLSTKLQTWLDRPEDAGARKQRLNDLRELQQLMAEKVALSEGNDCLASVKGGYKRRIMNKLAVLSIPRSVHSMFPTSGNRGFEKGKYQEIMNKDPIEAGNFAKKETLNWEKEVSKQLAMDFEEKDSKNRIFSEYEKALKKGARPGSKAPGDYNANLLWRFNYAEILKTPEKRKILTGELGKSYAKAFMAKTIAFTKNKEFKDLMSHFISEYEISFGEEEFRNYKEGLKDWLETNRKVGWITAEEMASLIDEHTLDKGFTTRASQLDKAITKRIQQHTGNSERMIQDQKAKAGIACASSKARDGEGCIFSTEPKEEGHEEDIRERNIFGNVIIHENVEIVHSIDATKLSDYLSGTQGYNYEEAREREAVVDLASKHVGKIVGDEDTVRMVKAKLGLDMAEMHHDKHLFVKVAAGSLPEKDEVHPKVLPKYTKIKASPSKMKEFAHKMSHGTGKVANYYGKVMLGNGILSALSNGDYEGLAVMGGRISIDVGFHSAEKLGEFMVSKASSKLAMKIGSGMSEIVGKIGGPIGGIADIGIDIWSMTSSIKALQDPRATRWEQNDAIADITSDSIDIAASATTVILSIAIPPLAPILVAVDFLVNLVTSLATAIVKSIDRVDALNDQIPLLGYEKSREGYKAFFGEDVTLYLKELIDIKKANNMVVNSSITWLVENPEYMGMVFPSKRLNVGQAHCQLGITTCDFFKFCKVKRYECGSEYGSWCPEAEKKCEDWGMDQKCICTAAPEPTWTEEDELDSYVDLRGTQDVYPYRAEPDYKMRDHFKYLCKPNSLDDRGDQVSKREKENAHLCDHAIGIEHESGEGKFMLYNLRDGTDTITLSPEDQRQNIIVVNDGKKEYNGNGGDDIFILEGPCTSIGGSLQGGSYTNEGNTLIVGGNCSIGNRVEINLASKQIWFGATNSLSASGFERVFGRQGIPDFIVGNCSCTLIAGKGGSGISDPDVIQLLTCKEMHLTVVAEGHTVIGLPRFDSGEVFIVVNDSVSNTTLVLPEAHLGGPVILKHITGQLCKVYEDQGYFFIVTDEGGVTHIEGFNGSPFDSNKESLLSIVWGNKTHIPFQIILSSPVSQAIFVLENNSSYSEAWGVSSLENIFHIEGGNWKVYGSEMNDTFHISNPPDSPISVDGGGGNNNIVVLGYLVPRTEINLFLGEIRSDGRETISVKNMQTVIGQDKNEETVHTSCSTRLLDLGGGSSGQPDMIFVGGNGGCGYDLSVVATGNTYIENSSEKGKIAVYLGPPDDSKPSCGSNRSEPYTPANFQFINTLNSTTQVDVIVNRNPSELCSFHYEEVNKRLKMEVGDDKLSMSILPIPDIFFKSEPNSRTIITQTSDSENGFVAVHTLLPNSGEAAIHPVPFLANQFLLTGGSWVVSSIENQGKALSLLIDSKDASGSYQGAPDGSSSVIFTDKVDGYITVNLDEIITLPGGKTIQTSHVGQWHGRPNQVEKLDLDVCKANLGLINLGGGRSFLSSDQVILWGSCNPVARKTVILAPGCTMCQVIGSGSYEIHVKPLDGVDTLKGWPFAFDGNFELYNSSSFLIPIVADPTQLSETEILTYHEKAKLVTLKFQDSSLIILTLEFKDGLEKEDFIPSSIFNALFVSEKYEPLGNLLVRLNPEPEILIYHNLENGGDENSRVRRGVATLRNTFRVNGSNWEVHGGNLDDTFILNTDKFNGMIQGYGGINTLILDSFSAPISIDLLYNKMSVPSTGSEGGIEAIEILNGFALQQELVTTNCFTKLLKLEGGASQDAPDIITIPHLNCNRTLSIIASTNTKILNSAMQGNFSYLVLDPKTLEVSYNLGPNVNHVFNFPREMVNHVSISPEKGSLVINFQGVDKQFPITPLVNQPIFQLTSGNEAEGTQLLTSVWVEDEGEGKLYPSTSTHSSINVKGLDGTRNHIVVLPGLHINSIQGGSMDDYIYLTGNTVIENIQGMGGDFNTLQISDSFWPKVNLQVDLRNKIPGGISVIPEGNRVVSSISNITIFNGRKSLGQEDHVILSCDTLAVIDAERIYVREPDCLFNTRITVNQGTRVLFELYDEYVDTDITDTSESEDISADPYRNISSIAPDSTFYYHLGEAMSFSVEIDDYTRLEYTQHYLYLNVSLGDVKNIKFDKESRNLSYTLLSDQESPPTNYKHQMFPLSIDDMFYPQPRIMTSDGFQIVIDKYEQIYFVFSNPDQTLDPYDIRSTFIPTLSKTGNSLKSIFMIDTGSDFLYSSNPDKPALLSNKENVTSHLMGWNGTTYYIIQGSKDVYVYPQGDPQLIQVIDVTNIMRNDKGKMLPHPDVTENPLDQLISPGTLTLHFKDTNTFSGVLKLANATKYQGSLRFLFGSVAHQLQNQSGQWTFQPVDIQIPAGYVYQLSAGDLNDDVLFVTESEPRNAKGVFTFSKWDNDLIVSNMDPGNVENGEFCSFVFHEFYNSTASKGGVNISLGNSTVHAIPSQGSLKDGNGNQVDVKPYRDVLTQMQNFVLQAFPTITNVLSYALIP